MALENYFVQDQSRFDPPPMSVGRKLIELNWPLVLMLAAITGVGGAMLYSAAGGWEPWSSRHLIRFGGGLVLMLGVAVIDIRIWMRLAYPIYWASLALIVWVELAGEIGMGAQRWINLGVFQLQPSELMKIALVLALARYYHGLEPGQASRPIRLLVPLALVALPTVLVLRQPDLGTAILIVCGAAGVFFLAGVSWKYFALALGGLLGALPIAWRFLHDYQKDRILTFLDPERDPLGAGYHILQSKIAFGSGGVSGKGFMAGTQSHLDFLPEMQTDFIYTMLAEEFGMLGALGLLLLYICVIGYGYLLAFRVRHQFGRLVILGVTLTFFLYVFINAAMVMGLVPVVGVPMPFVSYGGTAMLTLLFGFGLLLSASVHRGVTILAHPHAPL